MSNVVRLPGRGALSWDDCRLLVESVADYAIIMLDVDGHVTTWNIGAERINGYKADEIVGQHFSVLFPREDVQAGKPQRELDMAKQSGRVEVENWRVRKDGARYWANVIVTALHGDDGNLRGFGKVTRDLTQKRFEEEELRRSEERFHHLVDAVTDYAIFMLDASGHVATWNAGARRIKGYEPAEIIGRHFSAFFPPEDVAAGKPERILETVRRQGHYEEEGNRVRKDGSRFCANVVLTALRNEQGELAGFAKVTRDLTERRKAEEHLRLSEQRFHHLVDAVTDYAIFMLDASGKVATWNEGARRIKGYSESEITGQSFAVFYTLEDRAAGKPERILDAVRREGRVEDESWRVRKDGTRFWADVVITALRDDEGTLLGFAKVTRDLTDRRRAEEEMKRSEERFRLLVENVRDYAIYMLDPAGNVTTWNLGAERMKGYAPSEVIGKNFAMFFPKEDAAAGKPGWELSVCRAQGHFEGEGWRVRKDGARFWANAVLTAIHSDRGELIGFAKITRDLTTRRASDEKDRQLLREQTAREVAEEGERRLQESEERYRSVSKRLEIVLEGVADGITVQDSSGRVIFANTAAARICGFNSASELVNARGEEVVARFELLDSEGRPMNLNDLPSRRVLAGEETSSLLLQVRERQSSRQWWSLVRARAVLDGDGKPELAINIWHDVTVERRHEVQTKYLADATAALGSTLVHEEMLSTFAKVLVPALADWCTIYLTEGKRLVDVAVTHVDPAKRAAADRYSRRYAPDPEHAGGVWSVFRTGVPLVVNDVTDETLTKSTTDPEALALLRSIGIRAALLVPIRTRSRVVGVIALVCAQSDRRYDESDVALAEELGRRAGVALENAQLYLAAQAAAKTAEEANRVKDEFLATVSHELRTPLNAIVGWAGILKGKRVDSEVAKGIEVIDRNARTQVKIIEDILDVSRIITGKLRIDPKPSDLVAIVRDAIDVVRPSAAAKRIAINFTPEQEVCLLVGDPERLQQVVWNLLANAVKFTDRGTVDIIIRQEASNFVLVVTDSGKGIEPDFLPFVFDRFKQADGSTTRRYGGLGLGLAIVRHIVELHGGSVHAESAGPGKGSAFSITLPVWAVIPRLPDGRSEAAPRVEAPIARPGMLQGVRVLVVDDDLDTREMITTVLADAGAAVEAAGSAADGMRALRLFRPEILVSDIGMPDEDGYAFIGQVRALAAFEGGRIPSLALTAYTRSDDQTKALAAGFTTHIGKPVNPDDLIAAVANLAAFTPKAT